MSQHLRQIPPRIRHARLLRPHPRPRTAGTGAVLLEARGLAKDYDHQPAVRGIDFALQRGEVLGFLGPNGSGKTTTMRMLLGLIRPTGGEAIVLGADPAAAGAAWRAELGYVPGELALYERLTGRELVQWVTRARGRRDVGDAPALAGHLELDLDRPLRTLSRGNRQKVGLILALMHRPALLILDEPTSGLDPLMQQAFQEILRAAITQGQGALLASHVLSEVQQVADRVAVIRDGRLILTQSVDELRQTAFTRVDVTFRHPPTPASFTGMPGVRLLHCHDNHMLFALHGEVDPLVKRLAQHEVLALDVHQADLEDIFLALYEEAQDHAP